MAKNSVPEWSETAASNSDVAGINIAEGSLMKDFNNALRAIMAQIAALGWFMPGTLSRFGLGPNQDSDFAQFTTAFGSGAGSGATSTDSAGADRAADTSDNGSGVERADYSTFVGAQAGKDSEGHAMTLVGAFAGQDSVNGYVTTAVGQKAGYSRPGGTHFTGIGYRAGESSNGDYVNAMGYVSADSAVTDETVALGAFSYRFGYGNDVVTIGHFAGNAGVLSNSTMIGDRSGLGSYADQCIAIGGDNFVGVEDTGNNFAITAANMDIDNNRLNLTAGTAATNSWSNGSEIVVKWDGSSLTNPPVGLGGALFWYRFQVSIVGANEYLIPTGITLAENESGAASGSATLTPITQVTDSFVIGNDFDITASNAGGFLTDANEASTIKFGQAARFPSIKLGSGDVTITVGTGSPEGVVTAPVSSTFHRTDGGAGTSLYIKESGTGNTGWAGV